MNKIWYSKEWDDAPMPHAIFFTQRGHAIHGTPETKMLGKPASHGCVRLAPENATTLFALVKEKGLENTEIVLSGDTPRVESRVAKKTSAKKAKPPTRRSRLASQSRSKDAKPRAKVIHPGPPWFDQDTQYRSRRFLRRRFRESRIYPPQDFHQPVPPSYFRRGY